MIFDNIKNSELYFGVNGDFKKAFAFIEDATKGNLPTGKYEIDGNNVFVMVQEYTTNSPEKANFEGHRKYIDIQYVMEGVETIEVIDIDNSVSTVAYDENTEAEFFKCDCATQKLVLRKGDFAVFYPHDLHKPGLSFEGKSGDVKKIVVKVAL